MTLVYTLAPFGVQTHISLCNGLSTSGYAELFAFVGLSESNELVDPIKGQLITVCTLTFAELNFMGCVFCNFSLFVFTACDIITDTLPM